MKPSLVRLSEVADWLIIDQRTAYRALKRAGVKIIQASERNRRISAEDFERIKQTGLLNGFGETIKRQ